MYRSIVCQVCGRETDPGNYCQKCGVPMNGTNLAQIQPYNPAPFRNNILPVPQGPQGLQIHQGFPGFQGTQGLQGLQGPMNPMVPMNFTGLSAPPAPPPVAHKRRMDSLYNRSQLVF